MTTQELTQKTENKTPVESIKILSEIFDNEIMFSTSFGYEDQVITEMIFSNNIPVRVISLDTGRMFKETYKTFSKTRERYGKKIDIYFPETKAVEKLMTEKGPYSFYESIDNRKECCNIRKVEPLRRALKGVKCWITGLRRDQSEDRKNTPAIEWDEGYQLFKFNPLIDWSLDDVKQYVKDKNIPYNSLHDKGFLSIGCAPCTRAVQEGEDFRAGRWWWENSSGKECGIHTHGE